MYNYSPLLNILFTAVALVAVAHVTILPCLPCSAGREERREKEKEKADLEEDEAVTWGSTVAGVSVCCAQQCARILAPPSH